MPKVDLSKDFTTQSADTCSSMFISTSFTVAKNQKQPKSPTNDNDWIMKMWYIFTIVFRYKEK